MYVGFGVELNSATLEEAFHFGASDHLLDFPGGGGGGGGTDGTWRFRVFITQLQV